VLAILLAGAQGLSASETDSIRRVTLEEAIELFLANSPGLEVVKSARDEAEGLAEQSRKHPNPVANVTHEALSRSGVDYSETYLTASQRLDWPTRRSARADRADQGVVAAGARLEAETARLASEVKRAYVNAAALEEELDTLREVSAAFRRGQQVGQRRFAEGESSGYDVRRIGVERARYEELLASTEIDLGNARRRLAFLILPPGERQEIAPQGVPEGEPPSVSLAAAEAIALGMERRPEMRSAAAEIAAAEAEVRFMKTFARPDLTFTGGYKRQSDGFDGLFLGLSLPVPLLDRRQGDVLAAEARQRYARARQDLVRRSIENDVRRALETHDSVRRRVELLQNEILQGSDDILRIARVSYSEGEMTLLELLDAAGAFRDAKLALIRLRSRYWTTYFDLERAMGGPPVAREAEREK
jgi:cobalt-zinc-cadmium efflux system outer membrane protein